MFSKKTFLWAVLPIIFLVIPAVIVLGEDSDNVDDLQKKIDEYEQKISDLQGKAKTLGNEIEYMNSQISLTELKIQNSISKIAKTEEAIKKLEGDIDDLKERIGKLEKSIDYQKEVLSARIRERYKSGDESTMVVILGSVTLDTMVQKIEYLKAMERYDNKLLIEMGDTKTRYDMQKNLFEQKKEEEETLKTQLLNEKASLDAYKGQLDAQKEEKKQLLASTQNDEQKYQGLLDDALRELRQIQGAASVVIREGNGVDVERNEVIGTMGSSGNSTGPHLHFGVYRYSVDDFQDLEAWSWYYSNYVNPLDKLESKSVYWGTGCYNDPSGSVKSGKGDWEWPMSSVTLTQNYGSKTCYNWMYGGKPHPALDMVGKGDISVRAVEDGEAYFCRNCLGDGGNGVFIFHDDDYMTVYWHLK